MIISEDDYAIAHYGILRRSGRYPWGSGGPEYASNESFLGYVEELRKAGLSEKQIANGVGGTIAQLRAAKSIAKNEKKQADIAMAQRLQDRGWSNVKIGERMKIGESSVRALLEPGQKDKLDVLKTTSNLLRDKVDSQGYIDVGPGVELHMGVTRTKLDTAIAQLREEGYEVHKVQVDQVGAGSNNKTTIKVIAPPGTTYKELAANKDKITQIASYSDDGGRSYKRIQTPLSVDSKRVAVRYAEQGGTEADGVIYVRPGVKDVSLGGARYAQVRIAVNGTHYLKGMAMYKEDLPEGVDLLFNTNKHDTGNKLDAMKPLKDDPDSPFGSIVRQLTDHSGKLTSAINIVGSKEGMGEEGGWDKWSKNLSSQFLSKQSPKLAEAQLAMAFERKKTEFDDVMKLTNPAVKKKLLEGLADDADSSAVHLKAAALPRQENKVILPVSSMKANEIYAPTFRNGERVILVRHPHGGTFEIPELTVNNKHPEAKKLLGTSPKDAVGISSKVAERLSGADFDGDTVLVIPNNQRKIKTTSPLEGLKGFDPQRAYPAYEGMPKMSAARKQSEMGKVSNLITDMTIQGASHAELARAVRHSMVVIDAEKHNLNFKQSEKDNGIASLRVKYQGSKSGGATTLISKAGSRLDVPERKATVKIDPHTGDKIYTETGRTITRRKVNQRTGAVTEKEEPKTERTTKLAEAKDARDLISDSNTVIENVYAEHSNKLKALAKAARKEAVNTKNTPYSPSANVTYSKEVTSLVKKLNTALRNAPLERQAQVLANAKVSRKRKANPDMDSDDLKKVKFQALEEARITTGAGKKRVTITDDEWAAIQAGAISNKRLNDILSNADLDVVKQLATPKSKIKMTPVKVRRAQAMEAAGYTQAEIADALGVAVSTLKLSLSE